uniref:hypothetical protein n=1 Tax=Candidatus Onthocola sp. TaxID=3085646 RepID=UPI003FEEF322
MKKKISNYKTKAVIKLLKKISNKNIAEENIKTFDDLEKLAKQYNFEITIESTSKTDKMINNKY